MSRVEYILGLWQPPSGHSVGINTIQSGGVGGSGCVLTGGRDGRVCGWLPNQREPVIQYEAHTDWVNGLLETEGQIWSCSNDTTVKCYAHNQVTTIGSHQDYAKCISGSGERVYSAGLDGQVISWSPEGQQRFSVRVAGEMGGIYSLAAHNHLFASGGPDSVVRLWDSRGPTAPVRALQGHGDNVRALLMNDEWVVSGSSDSTVRLWSLRAGRLFRTWTNYQDSVFSLYSSDDLKSWYSGDREGKIHWTSREGHNVQVALQKDAVQGIVEMEGLWSGGQSCLSYWNDVMSGQEEEEEEEDLSPSAPGPDTPRPSMEFRPHVSLCKTLMLNDKRRVLVGATDGRAALVDLVRGELLQELPAAQADTDQGLEALAEEYNTMDVLDNWCHVSIRAGHLVVTLEERSAGSTEVYGDELAPAMGLDLGERDEDYRVNLGKWVLQALFASFVASERPRLEAGREVAAAEQAREQEAREQEAREAPRKERGKFSRIFSLHRSSKPPAEQPPSPEQSQQKQVRRETYMEVFEEAAGSQEVAEQPPFAMPADTRILISSSEPGQGAATVVFDCVVAEAASAKNAALLQRLLPAWVGEALWLPKMSSRTPVKIGFNLVPFDEGGPEILHNKGRLLANPILRANKTMAYAIANLKEAGHLRDAAGAPQDHLELYCREELVPPLMTLAMVRTRIWRNGGDVQLRYRIKGAAAGAGAAGAASTRE